MVRGLVVGKFMPLHKGHELLINTATKGCDELTVVVYDTPVDHPLAKLLPVEKRTQWVLDLFPQVTNVVSRRDILTDLPHEEKDKPEYAQDYADDLAFLASTMASHSLRRLVLSTGWWTSHVGHFLLAEQRFGTTPMRHAPLYRIVSIGI
jgi:cytidyltransferase-like protein